MNYESEPHCDSVTVAAATKFVLPDQPCKFVQIHNWTTNVGTVSSTGVPVKDGGTHVPEYQPALNATSTLPEDSVTGSEVYYGFNGKLCGQIFPGQRSDIMPCGNLNRVVVRPGTGGSREIFYTWWN